MIFRYHIFEAPVKEHVLITEHRRISLRASLKGLPQQLLLSLDGSEIYNELIDLQKQEAYLKITTEQSEHLVEQAVEDHLKMTGLSAARLI